MVRTVSPFSLVRLGTLVLVTCASLGAAGCYSTGHETGGELLTAQTGPTTTVNDDAGPQSWSDLYSTYFGPSAQASCTALSICHGGPTDFGSTESGFVCGPTAETCWSGLFTASLSAFPPLLPMGGSKDPTTTVFYQALHVRGATSGGVMPDESADGGLGYEFTESDMSRIASWIAQGAMDN